MLWVYLFLGVVAVIFGLSEWQMWKTQKIDKFSIVDFGVCRGSQPTLPDYVNLKEEGIKTVINLRENVYAEAETKYANCFGFNFINYPMIAALYPFHHQVENAVMAMSREANKPVFVHCTFGKDRTGVVCAMYRRKVQGWSKWAAWKEMWAHGFNPINIGLFIYYLIH